MSTGPGQKRSESSKMSTQLYVAKQILKPPPAYWRKAPRSAAPKPPPGAFASKRFGPFWPFCFSLFGPFGLCLPCLLSFLLCFWVGWLVCFRRFLWVVGGIVGFLVEIFPINKYEPHVCFGNGVGLKTVLLFSKLQDSSMYKLIVFCSLHGFEREKSGMDKRLELTF